MEESLNIAKQIGEALEAAHEKSIVHRDLKPANVKIKPDGTVKVLDFGLAKLGGTPAAPSSDSPPLTIGATEAGMVLGTAAYMSPEQARGKPVDKRADIWAFGVTLYEMIIGSDGMCSKVRTSAKFWRPSSRTSRNGRRFPASVKRLLRSCLTKDPKKTAAGYRGCMAAAR